MIYWLLGILLLTVGMGKSDWTLIVPGMFLIALAETLERVDKVIAKKIPS